MRKFEVLYSDRHTEIVDFETVDKLIDELEMFDRWDVCQIHELNPDGSLGETVWTEEEGLFNKNFGFEYESEEDED